MEDTVDDDLEDTVDDDVTAADMEEETAADLSLIHISEPTRHALLSRMPSSA